MNTHNFLDAPPKYKRIDAFPAKARGLIPRTSGHILKRDEADCGDVLFPSRKANAKAAPERRVLPTYSSQGRAITKKRLEKQVPILIDSPVKVSDRMRSFEQTIISNKLALAPDFDVESSPNRKESHPRKHLHKMELDLQDKLFEKAREYGSAKSLDAPEKPRRRREPRRHMEREESLRVPAALSV